MAAAVSAPLKGGVLMEYIISFAFIVMIVVLSINKK